MQVLLLEIRTWNPYGPAITAVQHSDDFAVIALDPVTASLLKTYSVPFRSIESFDVDRSWAQTNQELFDLLVDTPSRNGSPKSQETLDALSHYLIWEISLLYDRLCRIRAIVDETEPTSLIFGAAPEASFTGELFAMSRDLPWPDGLRLESWDLTSPLPLERNV